MIYLRAITIAIAWAAVSLAGCGGGYADNGPPPPVTTQILSDPGADGDIALTSSAAYLITQGMSPSVQSVFAGIDPVTSSEYRAFLDFPLTGPGGVPGDAVIESAFLDIYINGLQPISGSLPILIDLVAFQPPTLIGTDFDRTIQPPLASITITPPFTQADVGTNASLDVTALMVQAQQLGLNDFQVRIMEDLGPAIPVLMEINDTTGGNRASLAPQLTVTYF